MTKPKLISVSLKQGKRVVDGWITLATKTALTNVYTAQRAYVAHVQIREEVSDRWALLTARQSSSLRRVALAAKGRGKVLPDPGGIVIPAPNWREGAGHIRITLQYPEGINAHFVILCKTRELKGGKTVTVIL